MKIIEIQPDTHDWIFLRQILSLAILKKINTEIINGMNVLTINSKFIPLYNDIKNFLHSNNIAKIVETTDSIQVFPQETTQIKFSISSGHYSAAMEIALLLLPMLFNQNFRSKIELYGVTNSTLSYPSAFIDKSLFGILEKVGLYASIKLKRFGFYGSGGGKAEMKIYPAEPIYGPILSGDHSASIVSIKIFVSQISQHIANREKEYILKNLNISESSISLIEIIDADGYGNVIHINCNYNNISILLCREFPVYNEKGDFIFDEENCSHILSSLVNEVKAVLSHGQLPLPLLREIGLFFSAYNIPDGIITNEAMIVETKKLSEIFSLS